MVEERLYGSEGKVVGDMHANLGLPQDIQCRGRRDVASACPLLRQNHLGNPLCKDTVALVFTVVAEHPGQLLDGDGCEPLLQRGALRRRLGRPVRGPILQATAAHVPLVVSPRREGQVEEHAVELAGPENLADGAEGPREDLEPSILGFQAARLCDGLGPHGSSVEPGLRAETREDLQGALGTAEHAIGVHPVEFPGPRASHRRVQHRLDELHTSARAGRRRTRRRGLGHRGSGSAGPCGWRAAKRRARGRRARFARRAPARAGSALARARSAPSPGTGMSRAAAHARDSRAGLEPRLLQPTSKN
mmetsp:Transcript_31940/g.105933  ORF Transcript_31940/g.105933 Transcript_31940/m.105933 type:complete len:305 (+) Transcript_31940:955-1869(+)